MDSIVSYDSKKKIASKYIDESDMILVGIGTEVSRPWCDENEIREFFADLKKLIEGKQYFIITLNTDGYIRDCGFDNERLVEPCGSVHKLQCADACSNDIYNAFDYMVTDRICPKCGKPLIYNTVEAEHYVEDGYLDDWKRYTQWISSTLNRSLCVLEFGVKMEYPSVIKWPFEKIVSINNKAKIVRINGSMSQLSDEIAKKGTGIKGYPCRVIRELATD